MQSETKNNTVSRNGESRPWSFRRKVVIGVLLFDGFVILTCLFNPAIPEAVATTATASAFGSGMALIGSYIFGAVWHDKSSLS